MRLQLQFDPHPHSAATRSFSVLDETTTISGLPEAKYGPALLLRSGLTETWLTLDMTARISAPGTMALLHDSLFVSMTPEQELLWAEVTATRPLHPHEVASFRQRGLTGKLPEVVSNDLAAPLLAAKALKARVASVGNAAKLQFLRGSIRFIYTFDSGQVRQSVESRFAA